MKIILILAICVVLLHCNKDHKHLKQTDKSNFIDETTYKNIVKDIFCIEAAIYKEQTEGRNYTEALKSYYNWLYKKYGINRDNIVKSTEFYVSSGLMDSIMQEVIKELRYVQILLDTIRNDDTKYPKNTKRVFPFGIVK